MIEMSSKMAAVTFPICVGIEIMSLTAWELCGEKGNSKILKGLCFQGNP
jgi:hypothetical protein